MLLIIYLLPQLIHYSPQDCTHKQVTFFNVSALTLVAAPASFGGTVPLNLTPTIVSNSTHLGDLTAGTYIFNAIDVCGNPGAIYN